MAANLHELNKLEILRIVWDSFAHFARSKEALDSSTGFRVEQIERISFDKCKQDGLLSSHIQRAGYPPFAFLVRKAYYSAINMGLIIPGRADQSLDWDLGGIFQFTLEGIQYFSEGFISIDDPGHLGIALKELQNRHPSLDDGKIELLLESQRCIKAGCYRAGMVVIGVANEDMCFALLDSIRLNCSPPLKRSILYADWNSCNNSTLSFSMRWKPGIRILEEIKNKIRKVGKGENWFQWWEMIPGSLYTLGEAVRIARNSAAHDPNHIFSKAEVALLLSALPTQLEMLSNITEFLKSPPHHLSPIQL
jgi:hypothetical protein